MATTREEALRIAVGTPWFTDLANLAELLADLEERGELAGWQPHDYRYFLEKAYKWDAEWERLQAAKVCQRCEGSGEIHHNPSRHGDPQCVVDAECPECGGTGSATS